MSGGDAGKRPAESATDVNEPPSKVCKVGEEVSQPEDVSSQAVAVEDAGNARVPKRAMAIVIAYSGTGYHGFAKQVGQPDVQTIECLLEKIIYNAGGISASNFGDTKSLQKVGWSRAARTDKGVHAAMNLVGLKLTYEPPRTGAAKELGDDASEEEHFDWILKRINEDLPKKIKAFRMLRVIKKFDARSCCDRRQYEYLFPLKALLEKTKLLQKQELTGDELVEKMNTLMQAYVGTHNFHNFTNKLSPDKCEAKRYILKIQVRKESMGDNKTETCRVTLLGQSFLLHQIRKMVGLVVEEIIGTAPENAVSEALKTKEKRAVPKVPAEGLFLDRLIFDAYNTHKIQPPHTVSLEPDEKLHNELEEFKAEVIWPEICQHMDQPEDKNVWYEYLQHVIDFPYKEYGLDPNKLYPDRKDENEIAAEN